MDSAVIISSVSKAVEMTSYEKCSFILPRYFRPIFILLRPK